MKIYIIQAIKLRIYQLSTRMAAKFSTFSRRKQRYTKNHKHFWDWNSPCQKTLFYLFRYIVLYQALLWTRISFQRWYLPIKSKYGGIQDQSIQTCKHNRILEQVGVISKINLAKTVSKIKNTKFIHRIRFTREIRKTLFAWTISKNNNTHPLLSWCDINWFRNINLFILDGVRHLIVRLSFFMDLFWKVKIRTGHRDMDRAGAGLLAYDNIVSR